MTRAGKRGTTRDAAEKLLEPMRRSRRIGRATWGGGQPQTKGQGPADEAGACDMAEAGAAARHAGAGVKRRKAHHARQAAEREQVVRILISISIFRTVLVLHLYLIDL